MNTKFSKYFEVVDFLHSLNNYRRRPKAGFMSARAYSLFCTAKLLDLLGNPQKKLKFIHITGTAGKGSTAELIHQSLVSAGYRVGLYVSPHSTTTLERIKVDQKLIDPKSLIKYFYQIKPLLNKLVNGQITDLPSHFGIFLSIAMLYFAEKKCDYVILESHTGGLHDVTNVIPAPVFSIITNIGLDHQDVLGHTLSAIAGEKSGIIKSGSTFLSTEKRPALKKIMADHCRKLKVPYYFLSDHGEIDDNILIANKINELLGLPKNLINQAIKNFQQPCRFEQIQKNPLIILDGAHNLLKIERIVSRVKQLKYKKLHLVFTLSLNRDYQKILDLIAPLSCSIYLTRHFEPFHKTNSLIAMKDYCHKKWPKKPIDRKSVV